MDRAFVFHSRKITVVLGPGRKGCWHCGEPQGMYFGHTCTFSYTILLGNDFSCEN